MSRRCLFCLLLPALLWAVPARAIDFCVSNDTELNAALAQAELGITIYDGVARIQVVQGSYTYNGQRIVPVRLELLGGYSAGCASRTIDAANTTVQVTTGDSRWLETWGLGGLIEGITFQYDLGGNRFFSLGPGLASITQGCPFTPGTVRIRRNRFVLGNATDALVVRADCGDIEFNNNLVVGGRAVVFSAWTYHAAGTRTARIVNNTRVNWSQQGFQICAVHPNSESDFQASIYNNVLWRSAGGIGLQVQSSGCTGPRTVYAINNHWTGVDGSLNVNIGNSTVDPQLGANFVPADASPVVNSGANAVPGGLAVFDLVGRQRVIGGTVDRGAFETLVNPASEQIVTNTNDSGAGSLRQAIINANASPTLTTIRFNITTGSTVAKKLLATSPYPNITAPLIIDATSQSGSVENSAENGNNAVYGVWVLGSAAPVHAFHVPSGASSTVWLELKGLAIGGFATAVNLQGGNGHVISGNHFGGGLSDSVFGVPNNGRHILIGGNAANVRVGGSFPQQRNTLSGATNGLGTGVTLASSNGLNQILGNFIGTSRDGLAQNGNPIGIALLGDGAWLANNLISGNGIGLLVNGSQNLIVGNRIGTTARCSGTVFQVNACQRDSHHALNRLGNGQGVVIGSGAGANLLSGNTIAHNTNSDQGVGLRIDSTAAGNRLSGNRIYNHGELDLDQTPPSGPNPIRTTLCPFGETCRLNFPHLDSATGDVYGGQVQGVLRATDGNYRIELFASRACGPEGFGPGERPIGAQTVTASGTAPLQMGTATFDIPIEDSQGLIARYITATATRLSDGTTSEFSACVPYEQQTDLIFADGFE